MGLQNLPPSNAVPAHQAPSRPTSGRSTTSVRSRPTSGRSTTSVRSRPTSGRSTASAKSLRSSVPVLGQEGQRPKVSSLRRASRLSSVRGKENVADAYDENKDVGDDDNGKAEGEEESDGSQDEENSTNGLDDVTGTWRGTAGEEDPSGQIDLRLIQALQRWMPGYVIRSLPRQDHTARLPLFSAQLGKESVLRRFGSSESLETQLSLFSCSSHGSRQAREKRRRRLRRRKAVSAADQQKPQSAGGGSRWVELASKRKGVLDRFMMTQTHILIQGLNLRSESEAFELCDPDERRALFRCGQTDKMAFAARLRKSPSLSNVKDELLFPKLRLRTQSAGATTFWGKPVDFQELWRQHVSQRLTAALSLRSHRMGLHGRRSSGHERNLRRLASRPSLTSQGSGEIFFATPDHGTPLTHSPTGSRAGSVTGSLAELRGEKEQEQPEAEVSMWKGDSQILAIDLDRELTSKVKQRITTTTSALERVTGPGEDNSQRSYPGHLPEFPTFVEDDFARHPKIPQRFRISPELSEVIKADIRVRMGRPRYHEIRQQDLQLWDHGQGLGRAHTNLKVFNWLHSLREDQFRAATVQQDVISDAPPQLDDVTFGEMVLIRAVDEPDVKPLYEQKTKNYTR